MTNKIEVDIDKQKQCLKCLKWKNRSNEFFISYNEWHQDGKMPYCKKCIRDKIDEDNHAVVASVMRALDKPFRPDEWEKARFDKKETLGVYLKNINLNFKYDTYKDSVFDSNDEQVFRDGNNNSSDKGYNPEDVEEIVLTKEEMEFLVEFWGQGYEKEEYEFLQKEFERLSNGYEMDSPAMEILFQEASHMRLTIKRKRERGEAVDKELKTLQDLLGSANIKPAQETGANATEQASFGVLLKKYENEDPLPEPDEEWKDVDGIRKYISVWFLGHLSKMMGVQNDYADMYNKEIEKYTVHPPENDDEEDDE